MDDESVFGKVFYSLSFGDAIKEDLLTDYQIVVMGVDKPRIAELIEKREFLKTASGTKTDYEALASQLGLLKATFYFRIKNIYQVKYLKSI